MDGSNNSQLDRTVLYAPGLRHPARRGQPFLDALSECGVRVITPEPRSVFSKRGLDGEFRDVLEDWPLIQLAKANDLYRTLMNSGIEQADIVGYCEGGVTGTILASVHSEVVSQLVLVNSAGITKEDGSERLVDRFKSKNRRYVKAIMKDIVTGKVERSTYRMALANINRMLGMKALASLSEIHMSDTLKSLSDDGVKISVVHGFKDGLYPYEAVSANVPEGIHAYASFADPSAGHAVFESHTQDAIDTVINLLDL